MAVRGNTGPEGWDHHASHYVRAGPGVWKYDLKSNRWTGPADAESAAADTRGYRGEIHEANYSPDSFTVGPRPSALQHEKVLKSLPANTWFDLQPPVKFAGNKDWGALGYDAKRDMIYFYNGGHSAYGGTDVAHYHLATNRWGQPVEVESPLNFVGASGKSVPGWTFNRRPWVTNHLWNSYGFHPDLDRLLVAGRFTSPVFPHEMGQPDVNMYLYDPDLAYWEKRVPNNVPMSCMDAQILHAPGFGMLEWDRWLLDDDKLAWKKLEPQGKQPKSATDFCGFAYDAKRSRVLYFSGGYYDGTPYPAKYSLWRFLLWT